ncbi:hypothetical protein CYQ10_24565 (plasmid) [Escherichia coli]|nr:hypothetical protein CYQ10_24565 [Escherichia coli]
MFKRYIAPCRADGWRFMTLTIVTLWGSPLQFNVDKQNYPSVRRVLYQKQGDRMHLKVDDEVVFLYVVLIFCALAGFRRANASGACRIIQRRSLSGGSCGQAAVIAVT